MINSNEAAGVALVASKLGSGAAYAIGLLDLGNLLQEEHDGWISRRCFAASLNILLFHDLLGRVPSAAAYVLEQRAAGQQICFDHGALRTIRFLDRPTGALPPGERAFTRILEPLGYVRAGVYPLPRLRMTGRAYAHADAPAAMPQFFVSELHVEQFDADFGAAADAIFGSSRDPLGEATKDALDRLRQEQRLPFDVAGSCTR